MDTLSEKKPKWIDDIPWCSVDCPQCDGLWMCKVVNEVNVAELTDVAEVGSVCLPVVQQIVRSYHAHMRQLLKIDHYKAIKEYQEEYLKNEQEP